MGDVVIWDNRSVLHRATAYDTVNRRRLRRREQRFDAICVVDSQALREIIQSSFLFYCGLSPASVAILPKRWIQSA